MTLRLATLVLTGLIGFAALAGAQPALEPQRQGNVAFISGGVGESEQQAMQKMQGEYNLHLLFAEKNGDYLSGVNVQVQDQKGTTVLSTTTQGPRLFAKLPAGSYKVTASADGKSQTRSVSVGDKGAASESFYW
jgi:hypothetical protein